MVQRRATRWILSSYSPYQSVTELQQQLNLRTIEQRRVDAKVIMMFKIIHGLVAILHGLVAIPVPSYFEQPMRSTRHSHPLALRQIHTTANYYKFFFSSSTIVARSSMVLSTPLKLINHLLIKDTFKPFLSLILLP